MERVRLRRLRVCGRGSRPSRRTIVKSYSMCASPTSRMARSRKICAMVCLVALLLLWAPLWAAAWQAMGTDCCSGGMCPAHKNHTQNEPPCDHHGTGGISPCSISCCQTDAHAFVASGSAFLLPAPLFLSESQHFVARVMLGSRHELLPHAAPPDHPPRLLPS